MYNFAVWCIMTFSIRSFALNKPFRSPAHLILVSQYSCISILHVYIHLTFSIFYRFHLQIEQPCIFSRTDISVLHTFGRPFFMLTTLLTLRYRHCSFLPFISVNVFALQLHVVKASFFSVITLSSSPFIGTFTLLTSFFTHSSYPTHIPFLFQQGLIECCPTSFHISLFYLLS